MYEYRGTLINVVDGDTVHILTDLGFGISYRQTFRLAGINCPELSTPEGVTAKNFTASWFATNPGFIVRTTKDSKDNYGRYLGTFLPVNSGLVPVDVSLNAKLLASGNAVVYP